MRMQDVKLDGVSLADVDPMVLVQDVSESAPAIGVQSVGMFGGGSLALGTDRQYIDVTITFALRERRLIDNRRRVLSDVARWAANGGVLEISSRPDQHLNTICVQLPAPGDQREWTTSYTIVLRSSAIPYWQGESVTVGTYRASTGPEMWLDVPGDVPTPLEGLFTYSSQSGNRVNTIIIGDEAMGDVIDLRNVGLFVDETLIMWHGDSGRLAMSIIGPNESGLMEFRSVLDKRTPKSLDEYMLKPGRTMLKCYSNLGVKWEIKARGRYL